MPKILLVGGPLDGQSRDVPRDYLERPYIMFPEYAALVADFTPASELPEPVTINAHPYMVHKIQFRDPYQFPHDQFLYFGWHSNLKNAAEAMVMLMQHYENREEAGRDPRA